MPVRLQLGVERPRGESELQARDTNPTYLIVKHTRLMVAQSTRVCVCVCVRNKTGGALKTLKRIKFCIFFLPIFGNTLF